MGKLEDGPVDEEKVAELNKEISNLKQSLKDSEGLLLDSNKSMSQRNQDVVNLQSQIEYLTKDHIAADALKQELDVLKKDKDILKNENASFKKELEEQKQQVTQFQNERQD